LKYRVLSRFSEEARRNVAARVFNKPRWVQGAGIVNTCEEGRCIMAALFAAHGTPTRSKTPTFRLVESKLRATDAEGDEIGAIMEANDRGEFATPAAVRALLLGDAAPTGAASGGEETRP
jgi:hypothetical protein